MHPGIGPEGWLRCFAHPLGGVVCRGHAQYPAFARGSSKVAVGYFSWSLLSRICLNCACTWLFLAPYSFFVFCCSRRGVSRCQHGSPAAKGPRSQPRVPGPRLSPYHHTHCLSHRVLSISGFLRAPSKPHPCFPPSSTSPAWASPGRWSLVRKGRKTLAEGRHLVVVLVPCSRCQAFLPPSQAER